MAEGRARFCGGGGGIAVEGFAEILPGVSFPSAKHYHTVIAKLQKHTFNI